MKKDIINYKKYISQKYKREVVASEEIVKEIVIENKDELEPEESEGGSSAGDKVSDVSSIDSEVATYDYFYPEMNYKIIYIKS